jgi:hypothetical protein
MSDQEIALSAIALFSPHKDGEATQRIRRLSARLTAQGCVYMRATRVGGGIWLEGWLERPQNEGEFNLNHARKVLPK